jgi:hypothetical protein
MKPKDLRVGMRVRVVLPVTQRMSGRSGDVRTLYPDTVATVQTEQRVACVRTIPCPVPECNGKRHSHFAIVNVPTLDVERLEKWPESLDTFAVYACNLVEETRS